MELRINRVQINQTKPVSRTPLLFLLDGGKTSIQSSLGGGGQEYLLPSSPTLGGTPIQSLPGGTPSSPAGGGTPSCPGWCTSHQEMRVPYHPEMGVPLSHPEMGVLPHLQMGYLPGRDMGPDIGVPPKRKWNQWMKVL